MESILEAVTTHGPQTLEQLAGALMVHKAVVLRAATVLAEQGRIYVSGGIVVLRH